jgi:two-component system, response regulator PdtaR
MLHHATLYLGLEKPPFVSSVIPMPDASARTVTVLVAEDEVLLRLMMADVLREQGFQVFEAANPDEAISILRTMPVDVVITDLHMRAVGDGMQVAKHVRDHCPSIALLLASAHAPPIEGSPFDAFFMKPYRPDDIAMWIRRRSAASPGQMEGILP